MAGEQSGNSQWMMMMMMWHAGSVCLLWKMSSSCCRQLVSLTLLVLLLPTVYSDLYKLLGVARDASVAEIKRAYRRKALDTHPDKNPNSGGEEFRKVVDAFEILSNAETRKNYDRTGRTTNTPNQWQFQWRRQQSLKDSRRVKEAKMRVMHVVSMAQLETVMLGNESLLERNLLLCFYTPSSENVAENTILFPYPFAGMSAQGIWWEDILQTVIVRYHRSNDLVRFFHVESETPTFVFLHKGDRLEDYTSFTTENRVAFETWTWKQLEVQVDFLNKHNHPVELYWIDGTRAKLQSTISPGGLHRETTMLSHQYVARDHRVDQFETSPGRYKLTPNTLLGSYKIVSLHITQFLIETRPCIDMSGHCEFWSETPKEECDRNPGFMHATCPLTCKVCSDTNESLKDEL